MKHWVAVAAAIALAAAIYLLRLDDAAGLIKDDAWYVVLAKALATGQGFRLISSATTPILPAVPPGYPALLAPIFLVAPHYPENLLLLKAVSLIAMFVVGIACYVDYTRNRNVPPQFALALTVVVVLTPSFVFLATSTTMSECVFVAAQMCAVLAVERAATSAHQRSAVFAGVLVALSCLIRTAGFALAIASVVYLVVRRRLHAVPFAVTAALLLVPWQVYSIRHQPTDAEREAHGGTIAYSYGQLVAMTRSGSKELISIRGTIDRAIDNTTGVLTRDLGAALMPVLYRGGDESGEEVVSVGEPKTSSMGNSREIAIVSAALALVVLAGVARAHAWLSLPALMIAASVGLTSLVGTQTFRYILPLIPFLVFYVWHAVRGTAAARIVVTCLLVLHVLDHGSYLRSKWNGTADWLGDAKEAEQVLSWLRAPTGAGTVASTNPGLVYLRTGRQGIYLIDADARWTELRTVGIRYLAAFQPTDIPLSARRERTLGETARRRLWAIELTADRAVEMTESDKK